MKIAILEGKIYQKPLVKKTKNGNDYVSFSIGINNSYKKDDKWVDIPPTYFNVISFKYINEILNYPLKTKICLVVNIDKNEYIKDDKRYVQDTYNLVTINPDNLTDRIIEAIRQTKPQINTIQENKDDLPF